MNVVKHAISIKTRTDAKSRSYSRPTESLGRACDHDDGVGGGKCSSETEYGGRFFVGKPEIRINL
jgi:hypothetical protein